MVLAHQNIEFEINGRFLWIRFTYLCNLCKNIGNYLLFIVEELELKITKRVSFKGNYKLVVVGTWWHVAILRRMKSQAQSIQILKYIKTSTLLKKPYSVFKQSLKTSPLPLLMKQCTVSKDWRI